MKELIELIQKHSKTDPPTLNGTVKEVNEAEMTCTLEADGIGKFDVRLQAMIDKQENKFLVVPKEGSQVIACSIEGDNKELFIAATSEIDKVSVVVGKSSFSIAEDGISIKGREENLSSIIADFITEVSKIVVAQGTSPNVPALKAITARLNKVLI